MALAAASNWLSNFIVGLIVPPLVKAAPYGSFTLFAVTTSLALLWVYFFVPETNQKTLEDLSHSTVASSDEELTQRLEIISELLRHSQG